MEELLYKKQSAYERAPETTEAAFRYAGKYMEFLDRAKTEREAVAEAIRLAEANGFRAWKLGEPVKAGDKLYLNNRGRSRHTDDFLNNSTHIHMRSRRKNHLH